MRKSRQKSKKQGCLCVSQGKKQKAGWLTRKSTRKIKKKGCLRVSQRKKSKRRAAYA